MLEPVIISNYINKECNETLFYPLLDTCHYMILRNRFNSSLKYNLKEMFELYNSENFAVHLADIIGSGNNKDGGIHGSDFSYNPSLLRDIIKYLLSCESLVILEVNEDDFTICKNAENLHNRIKEMVHKK